MQRIVLDANIYVSAFAFGGKPKRAVQLGITRRVAVSISDPIRAEVLRTLRNKFRWSEERLLEATAVIGAAATSVAPAVTLHVIERDPDDDRVLECAVAARAEFIVSGDFDLLSLGEYEGIQIIQVAELLDRVGDQEPPPKE